MILCLDFSPDISLILVFATPKCLASAPITALFASPSWALAWVRTIISPFSSVIFSTFEPGLTVMEYFIIIIITLVLAVKLKYDRKP